MLYRLILFSAFLISSISSFATPKKNRTQIDSLGYIVKAEPDIGLSGNITKVKGYGVSLTGAKVGISWQRKYSVGFGYHFINSNIGEEVVFDSSNYATHFKFGNGFIYGEYKILSSRKVASWIGLRMGPAWINNKYIDNREVVTRFRSQTFFAIEPYASATYRILPYLGISVGLGYRLTAFSPPKMNALTGSVGIAISPSLIWKEIE